MEAKDPEISAMEVTYNALEPLEEAARLRVVSWVIAKLNLRNASYQSSGSTPPPSTETKILKSPVERPEIKDFLAEKAPKDTYQRLTCLGFYLERYEGTQEYDLKVLTDANFRARQPPISNISTFMKDATAKYQFFSPTPSGQKQLTTRGFNLVENLPDQQKAKEALGRLTVARGTKGKRGRKDDGAPEETES